MILLPFLCIFLIFKEVLSKMEPFIVGGDYTEINQYPHSVFLNIDCKTSYICGGSILNQDVVLTAGHCMEECKRKRGESVLIKYGHEDVSWMRSTSMRDFKIHESYSESSLHNDISIITCKKPIVLSGNVKRVVIMKSPPVSTYAYVAGWGVVNKNLDITSILKHTYQKMQPPNVCRLIGSIPKGAFCAGPINADGNPNQGDSGSALVIKSYIQIGIVSYKVKGYTLVAYTNVSYYYDWIMKEARKLYCDL